MKFDHTRYVPCLRWNQGEYQAVLLLKNQTKEMLTPLIEVSEREWDFELEKPKKTLEDHIAQFAKRIKEKWGDAYCFIDTNPEIYNNDLILEDGTHPIKFIFNDIIKKKINGVPVTGVSRSDSYNNAVKDILDQNDLGICFRVKITECTKSDFKTKIDTLIEKYKMEAEKIDIILDLECPDFPSIEGFSKAIINVLNKFPYYTSWKTFTILGTSIPKSMADVKKGIDYKPRNEWILYKSLIGLLNKQNMRLPSFGDYTINHPNLVKGNMKFFKKSAKVIYAIDDQWCFNKGDLVERKPDFFQFHDLCLKIVKLPYYMGKTFSEGSRYIYDCANKKESHGNLTTWKKVGTNHHIEKVVYDIANFFSL